ncbi:MAG TPA: oligosaccharide flippase family protein [Acidimicrobiales bacterium]|nr:oligosaccharide flippase family protein [Acidimicrobiales bacterium]
MTAAPDNERAVPAGQSLVGTTARIAVSKAVSGAASAGVVVVTARELGPEGRGEFVLLFTLATFAMIVCGLGISISGRIRLVAADNPVSPGDYLGLVVALSAVQAAVCALAATTLLRVFDVHLDLATTAVFVALGVCLFVTYMSIEALNAFGFTVQAALVDVVGSVVQFALVLFVAVQKLETVEPFLAALAASFALQVVMSWVALHRFGVDIRPRFRREAWARLLRDGPPSMAVLFGQHAVFKIDRYLIALFLTPGAVGVYSVAAAFPEMLRVLPTAMAVPVFYGIASRSGSSEEFARARRLCIAAVVVVGAAVMALAPIPVRVLFGDAYDGAVGPLRLLIVAEIALAIYYIDGAALTGQARVRETAAAVLVGVVVALISYVALIRPLGLNGAALGSVIAYASMALVVRNRLGRVLSG